MLKDRIRTARNSAKISQEELSKSLGIGKRTLIDYENGISEPKASIIIGIAENCNVNEWWLLTGKGSMHLQDDMSVADISNNHNSGIIVGNNSGSISVSINKDDFKDDSADIEELISLLKYAPKSFILKINEKLRAFKDLAEI